MLNRLLDLYHFDKQEYLFLLEESNFAKKQEVYVVQPPYHNPTNRLSKTDLIRSLTYHLINLSSEIKESILNSNGQECSQEEVIDLILDNIQQIGQDLHCFVSKDTPDSERSVLTILIDMKKQFISL